MQWNRLVGRRLRREQAFGDSDEMDRDPSTEYGIIQNTRQSQLPKQPGPHSGASQTSQTQERTWKLLPAQPRQLPTSHHHAPTSKEPRELTFTDAKPSRSFCVFHLPPDQKPIPGPTTQWHR